MATIVLSRPQCPSVAVSSGVYTPPTASFSQSMSITSFRSSSSSISSVPSSSSISSAASSTTSTYVPSGAASWPLAKSLQPTTRTASSTEILCIGDSLTQGFLGFGETGFSPYTDRLTQRFKSQGKQHIKVQNNGITGEQTCQIRKRLEEIVKGKVFDWVVLLGGANDLGRRSVDDIIGDLMAMHTKVRQMNARVIMMTVPACSRRPTCDENDRLEVNKRLRAFALANQDSTMLIDVATALPQDAAHAKLWGSDTLHFSPEGYQALGDLVADKLLSFM